MWLFPIPKECTCKNYAVGAAKMLQVADIGYLKIASWFHAYMVSSGQELWERPCVSTIQELAAYNRAISSASECSLCRRTVVESMEKFRALYIAQVKKVVATVSFPC
jgi:hypothetical protein